MGVGAQRDPSLSGSGNGKWRGGNETGREFGLCNEMDGVILPAGEFPGFGDGKGHINLILDGVGGFQEPSSKYQITTHTETGV